MNATTQDRLVWLAAVLVAVGFVHLLQPILMPFLVAAALAYLWDPVIDRLERIGLARTLCVVLVFTLMTLLVALMVLVLVPLLGRQLQVLAGKVPVVIQWFKVSLLPWLSHQFDVAEGDIPLDRIREVLVEHWQSAGAVVQDLLISASSSGLAVIGWMANLVLIPVVTFYLLRDWDHIMANVRETLPRALEPVVVELARECDEVVSAFLRGQLLVMLALGVCYTVGLMLVGLELALLIGMLAGLASIVPYLGLLLGFSAAAVAALVQFGDWHPLVWIGLVFGLAQLLEGMVLTPRLVGERIGLHPVVVIFAVMAGGQLFGFTGVLLALPVAAVIMVLLRHAHGHYRASSFYGADTAAPESAPAIPDDAVEGLPPGGAG